MIGLGFGTMLCGLKYCVVYNRIQWFGSKKINNFDNSIFWFGFLALCHQNLNSNSISKAAHIESLICTYKFNTHYIACLQLIPRQCHWWRKAVCSSCVSYEGPLPRPPSLPSPHEPAKREGERKMRRQGAVRGEWGGGVTGWSRWSWWMRGWGTHCTTLSPESELTGSP